MSNTFTVNEADNSLAVFMTSPDGRGNPGILNCGAAGCAPNDLHNPAQAGSIITFFATSSGILNSLNNGPMPDGAVDIPAGSLDLRTPVSLTIGGQPATILYAGLAPFQIWGTLQVNAEVPSGLAAGLQPAVLTIGRLSTAGQNFNVAVQ